MAFNNTTDVSGIFDNVTSGFPGNFSRGGPNRGGGPPCYIPMTEPEKNIYGKVEQQLWLIIPPIVTVIGVVGNVLTVAILLRQLGRWSSTAVFLFVLALSDTVQLLNSPVRNWIFRGLEKHDVRHLSELGCKFSFFFTYGAVQFSSWILVAVTVERFVSVRWPHRVREGCTPRSSTVVVFIILVIIIGLNAHIFYGVGVSDLPQFVGQGYCEVLTVEYQEFWEDVWPWIDFAVAFALPFLILTVCNSMIIYKLQKTQVKIRRLSVIESSGEKAYAKDKRNVTITLVLLSVVFLICLTPVQVYFILSPYKRKEIDKLMCVDFDEFYRQYSIDKLVYTTVNIVSYINAAFNFILYVLSGNKFRSELKNLLMCRKSGRIGVFGSSSSGSSRRRLTQTTMTSTRDDSRMAKNVSMKVSNGVDNKSFTPDTQTNVLNGSSIKNGGNNLNGVSRVDEGAIQKQTASVNPVDLGGIDIKL